MVAARLAGLALIALLTGGAARQARAERPRTEHLVLAGLGMAPPTYFLGVAIHEGSHALTASLFGADILEFRVLPFRHPRTGDFYFGYVSFRGQLTDGQRFLFFVAPKLVDLAMLGGYTALIATDTVPGNRYGRLALAVLATGFWVDFSKDIPAYWDHNDLVKAYNLVGLRSEWQRLPVRILHAGLSLGAAYVIYRGYDGVFGREGNEPATMFLPLWQASF
jgi:hypothetical protein